MGSIDVISSQIDVLSIVQSLMLIERQPIVNLDKQVAAIQSKVNAYQTFNTRLSALSDKINMILYGSATAPFNKPPSFAERFAVSAFAKCTTTSSDKDVISATASNATVGGVYDITVERLAQTQAMASVGFAGINDAIGTGSIIINQGQGDDAKSVTIELTEENNTLKGLQKAINAADIGVTASIINDGSEYRLMLTSNKSGTANAFAIDASGFVPESGGSMPNFTQTRAALDAQFTVNGIGITKGSNTVDDVIDGVTLTLKKTTASAVKVSVERDTDSVMSAIKDMVSAYNTVNSFINSQFTYNASRESAGVLSGDATLRSIQAKLQGQLAGSVSNALSGPYRVAGQLGLEFNRDGSLALNEEKLREAMAKNPEAVSAFFLGDGASESMLTNLSGALGGITDSLSGPIKSAMDGMNKNIKSIQDSIRNYESRLEVKERMLTEQFSAADQALRLLKLTQSSIGSSLSSNK